MNDLHLYKVVLRDITEKKGTFVVASWLGPNKAIAMAVLANSSKSRSIRLFDVAVEDLGVAPATVPPDALVDRMEF